MAEKNIIVERSPQAAAQRAAQIFKSVIFDAVGHRGRCCVALSGGTTPRALFQMLAEQAIVDGVPWHQVEFFFGDERDVPHDNVESNFHTAQRSLLDHVPIDWEKVHPMRADADDIEAAAAEYEETIRQRVPADEGGVPQFDLIMLGLGGDGHTASLFPDLPNLDEAHRLVMSCHVAILGRDRMTFTFPLINAARNIMFLISGDDKADACRRVFREHDPELPASRIHAGHGTVHVIVDRAAARLL